MKPSSYNRISTIVLGACMLVTIVITAWFFIDYVKEANGGDTAGTSALIYWLYIVLILTFVALLGGVLWSHFKNNK
jgi:TRAP-type C4-dicarboxylate transport system permease small subunit